MEQLVQVLVGCLNNNFNCNNKGKDSVLHCGEKMLSSILQRSTLNPIFGLVLALWSEGSFPDLMPPPRAPHNGGFRFITTLEA